MAASGATVWRSSVMLRMSLIDRSAMKNPPGPWVS